MRIRWHDGARRREAVNTSVREAKVKEQAMANLGWLRRILGSLIGQKMVSKGVPPSGLIRIDPDHVTQLPEKINLTEEGMLILNLADDGLTGEFKAEQASIVRDGHGMPYLLYPDGVNHHPRIQPMVKGKYDRVRWVNLLVACDGPQHLAVRTPERTVLSRD